MEIEAHGVETLALTADMSVADDNRRIVSATIEKFGGVDILINNSGDQNRVRFVKFLRMIWMRLIIQF